MKNPQETKSVNQLKLEKIGRGNMRCYVEKVAEDEHHRAWDGIFTVCVIRSVNLSTDSFVYHRGIAYCSPKDQYIKSIGHDIAIGRAIQAFENAVFGLSQNYGKVHRGNAFNEQLAVPKYITDLARNVFPFPLNYFAQRNVELTPKEVRLWESVK